MTVNTYIVFMWLQVILTHAVTGGFSHLFIFSVFPNRKCWTKAAEVLNYVILGKVRHNHENKWVSICNITEHEFKHILDTPTNLFHFFFLKQADVAMMCGRGMFISPSVWQFLQKKTTITTAHLEVQQANSINNRAYCCIQNNSTWKQCMFIEQAQAPPASRAAGERTTVMLLKHKAWLACKIKIKMFLYWSSLGEKWAGNTAVETILERYWKE